MGGGPQQYLALGQRFAHLRQSELFQIAEAAMDQSARPATRRRTQVALLEQGNPHAPHGGISRNSCAVDAATDDDQIEIRSFIGVGCQFTAESGRCREPGT